MGLICILVGAFWVASSIAALVLGLTFVGNVEATVLRPVDFIRDTVVKAVDVARGIDLLDLVEVPLLSLRSSIERPLLDLRGSIEHAFTTIKLVYAGVMVWLSLPQLLLIYTGWLLRKGTSTKQK